MKSDDMLNGGIPADQKVVILGGGTSRPYQEAAVKMLLVDDNPFRALDHQSDLIEAHLNGQRTPEMRTLFVDWDRAAQEDAATFMKRLEADVDAQCQPEDLPKVNRNGTRMAVQPLDRRQNYLTLRNRRW